MTNQSTIDKLIEMRLFQNFRKCDFITTGNSDIAESGFFRGNMDLQYITQMI